jgi:hypothetical protein
MVNSYLSAVVGVSAVAGDNLPAAGRQHYCTEQTPFWIGCLSQRGILFIE